MISARWSCFETPPAVAEEATSPLVFRDIRPPMNFTSVDDPRDGVAATVDFLFGSHRRLL